MIGGGARSGKSRFALHMAEARGKRRLFVATAEAFDDEMRTRIERHRAERGGAFETVEAPRDLDAVMARLAGDGAAFDVVVIDCITLWLSNLLLRGDPASQIERRVDALASALVGAPFGAIVVTNEVGMGLVPETPLGRAFRDVAGAAHQRLAASASELYLATLGAILRLRPAPVALVDHGRGS